MAYTYVKDILDFEENAIKIAKKYGGGGGSVDLSMIADIYDETHQYPYNDMVIHDNKLYKATTAVNTPGVFNPDMWNEILPYDSSSTYNSGDYATYTVEDVNKCFRCDEDNTTGDWDASKWTDVSETDFPSYDYASTTPYYPNSSKVALRYPGSYTYWIANSTYAPTGGAGEWNSAKWTETTVEAVINGVKVPYGVQTCSTADIATDSDGFMTNSVAIPPNGTTVLGVYIAGAMPALNKSYLIEAVQGLSGGNRITKYRILDLDGTPKANVTAGDLMDAGVVITVWL